MPNTIPTVIPPIPPSITPFFQPKAKTINIHTIFLIENEKTLKFPNAEAASDIIKPAPTTSSIENAFLIPNSLITDKELTNIL